MFDLGAGSGAITARLAATGARVIAVERDPKLAARLRRRFCRDPRVHVVEADLRTIPLPRREFLVVASPPFSLTRALCRRLLADRAVRLLGAELILQLEAARRLADPRPRDAETAWWSARYQMHVVRVISPASFAPPPFANAAWLSVRSRPVAASARGERCLREILRLAYRRPSVRTEVAVAVRPRLLLSAGLDPALPVAGVTADQWHRLAVELSGGDLGASRSRRR